MTPLMLGRNGGGFGPSSAVDVVYHGVPRDLRGTVITGPRGEAVPVEPPSDELEPFDANRYAPLPAVPVAHLAYLERMRVRGEPPLMFVHIPHVLVGGPLGVSGLNVVSWAEPPTQHLA
jgi:hypothetical protein